MIPQSLVAGVAGASRNAAVALCEDGRALAICEEERISRTRHAGLTAGELPTGALETTLQSAGRLLGDVQAFAVADDRIQLPPSVPVERFDHHFAHAAAAYLSSPFSDATVVVCDHYGSPEVTVWRAMHGAITPAGFEWEGPGFASLYSHAAAAFGFKPDRDEYRLEALAQVGQPSRSEAPLLQYAGHHVDRPATFKSLASSMARAHGDVRQLTRAAADVQQSIGDALEAFIRDVHGTVGGKRLCLGGGLFFNSYFNTRVAQTQAFEQVFVPVNPGNGGTAVGSALAATTRADEARPVVPLSPFLGPEFDDHYIKATLDNCKLSYDHCHEGQIIEQTVAALAAGRLVGWFRGRMEWGPRALGNRSILASPVAPYVLDNLNTFLKRREAHRPYSVSVCEEDLSHYFGGPPASRVMEYEYTVHDPSTLRYVLPLDATRLRVQSVPSAAGLFHRLITAFGSRTGVPILVNTSFNGFNEPIVCSPRDAIRVFYGTGLDMAVVGNFILRK